MEVDSTAEQEPDTADKDASAPKRKKRKPSVDIQLLLSAAVSSLPELAPDAITDLLRRSSNTPGNVGKQLVKTCKNVEHFQQCFSDEEKRSYAAIKGITLRDMQELKELTDMQRVALRYHQHSLRNVQVDYNINGMGKHKKQEESGDKKEVEKSGEKKQKKVKKSLPEFVGEHIHCPAIPKNHRRKIEMITIRIDKKNPVKDLRKKLQLELKNILSTAAKLPKGALSEFLKDCKDWERDSVHFTLKKLPKNLSSEQKYNKKELGYIRFHIHKTQKMVWSVLIPKSPAKKS